MWKKPDEKEKEPHALKTQAQANDMLFVGATLATTVASSASASTGVQTGGADTNDGSSEPDKPCPKDDYIPPTPWLFILFNLCVPLSPIAHLIGGNRETALTRFLYLFAGVIFAFVFTIIFGILWFFLPSSLSDVITSIYPYALAIISLAYVFAVVYDYLIMFFIPSELFFKSKQCNLNGFVGFAEDPPCPSTQNPMSVISTVFKPATDIVFSIFNFMYKNIYGTIKSVGTTVWELTPQGAAIKMATLAADKAIAVSAGKVPVMPGMPGMPAMPAMPAMPVMPTVPAVPAVPAIPAIPGMPEAKAKPLAAQKGGAYKELDPLDYLGAGVIGAVLVGGFILGSFRNVSRREYWLNDTPPNPRGV